MVKILDNYYFKEMTGEELERNIEEAISYRPDIRTQADAEKLMGEE